MPLTPENLLSNRATKRVGASLCGRYSILRLVGIGGMAAVYAGVHRNGHGVAIKILHEGLASDRDIERLFRREAQLANRVGHPGVVPVIDDDVTEDGCVFLVMPFLEGETMGARAERFGGNLPLEEVLLVGHAVLGVLGAAHAKKIVHRDIKPENIFLTTAGDVRLLDFGIGRFFETADRATATRSGRAFGTPAFMAPEQALGRQREVDGRTDLWALGATMFSLLSGRFVHEAESATEIAILAATRPPRALGTVASDVPAAVRDIVDRALSFRKEDRWRNVEEMDRALLEACEAALGIPLADLPVISAPSQGPTDDLASLPTSSLPAVAPTLFDERPAPSAPAKPLREAATPTSTSAILSPRDPRRVAQRGHFHWRRAAIVALGATFLAAVGTTLVRRPAAAVGGLPNSASKMPPAPTTEIVNDSPRPSPAPPAVRSPETAREMVSPDAADLAPVPAPHQAGLPRRDTPTGKPRHIAPARPSPFDNP